MSVELDIYGAIADYSVETDAPPQIALPALLAGKQSWPALCALGSGFGGDVISRAQSQLKINNGQPVGEWGASISEWLRFRLPNTVLGSHWQGYAKEKIVRIGLPLHLRLMRDSGLTDKASDAWNDAEPIVCGWIEQSNRPEKAESWWMWCHIFKADLIQRVDPVQIGTVAVGEGKGRTGSLKVSSIAWPPNAPKPSSGFVPHPNSFAYCLDDDFREAFSNCHTYLKSIGVWDDGVVLEWDLDLDGGASYLKGGSIGAALALAAGALLARQKLSSAGA